MQTLDHPKAKAAFVIACFGALALLPLATGSSHHNDAAAPSGESFTTA